VGIGVTMENMKLSHICLNEIASCELEVMEMCWIHVYNITYWLFHRIFAISW